MGESEIHELDYFYEDRRASRLSTRTDETAALLSTVCAIVPFIGLAMGIGVLIIVGITISAWIGIILGLTAATNRHAPPVFRVVGLLALAVNGMLGAIGFFFVFGGGFC